MNSRGKITFLVTFAMAVGIGGFVGCDSSTDPEHFADENWQNADMVRGGLLYDKWWTINSGTEPTTDFDPIWSSQTTNARTGADSWRCKECHGWDYVGKDGRYSSGSHYTGFDGVWTVRGYDKTILFDSILDENGDHDLSAVLSEQDALDLTKFIVDGLVNMSLYIDASGNATGDTTSGETLYNANCATCHGTDGLTLDFKSTTAGIQGVRWLADDNPHETLHKIRWGHPGSVPELPSMVENGLTAQQTGNILAHAQTLPGG